MKVIVLGGAGDMGSRAVEHLVRSEGVQRVTIADRNAAACRELLSKAEGGKAAVDIAHIDADNHAQTVAALAGYDVAASALGPYFLYETKLVRAALEAGIPYASICDEWEAAGMVIDRYDRRAREQGITMITGLGTSPGLSNVGVGYLTEQLDHVRRVDVCVYQPLDAGGGPAVVRHMLHILSGEVPVWRGGERRMVPACSESRRVEFPRFGTVQVWNMGHSEPETIPRFVAGIEEVSFLMGFGRGSRLFVWPARLGLFGSRRICETIARLVSRLEAASASATPADGAVRIDVWGEIEGAEIHRIACGAGQMREATGLSLSIGAQMLGRGELLVDGGGVYAPEACLDARIFLGQLAAEGVRAYTDLEMTEPVA